MKKSKTNIIFRGMTVLILLLLISPFAINQYVISSMAEYIIFEENAAAIEADCILVLGAGLKPDGTPNDMLRDRLDKGIQLYNSGVAPKLLLSGDNGQEEYDEVNAMKFYVSQRGIPEADVFLDYAGFSTYESMYRADYIFQVKTAIVVTQKYHLYRALFDAKGLGVKAYGVSTEARTYAGQDYREIREVLARNKDFLIMFVKPEPTYLGEAIPITLDGNANQE